MIGVSFMVVMVSFKDIG